MKTPLALIATIAFGSLVADACTGITLTTADNSTVVARTIEWGGTNLNSEYVIVPRGYTEQSLLPDGKTDGLKFSALYGYVGLAVNQKEFVAEGINEAGLSAGLFYFPNYGKYEPYNEASRSTSLSDLQVVPFVLSQCGDLDDVKKHLEQVHIINIDPRASTVHWRFADSSGKQIVLEIIDGKLQWYDNPLGVITNAPDFRWQLTNLNNYVNLYPGSAKPHDQGAIRLAQFGAGSGFLGIPGDVTPPSRFVRATFYATTAPTPETTYDAVLASFHILNNFDIPIGIEFTPEDVPQGIPSATQWTSATDLSNLIIYFRTMFNSTIRAIDLRTINFTSTTYQHHPLDPTPTEPIQYIAVE